MDFVVSSKTGTPAQKFKWLWEQQRSEFILLQQQNDRLIERCKKLMAENRTLAQQVTMAERERDTFAAALEYSHDVANEYKRLMLLQ